ncbi:MAG: hypothetical protein QM796_03015 [Chthoniobacteraceae bacterium]
MNFHQSGITLANVAEGKDIPKGPPEAGRLTAPRGLDTVCVRVRREHYLCHNIYIFFDRSFTFSRSLFIPAGREFASEAAVSLFLATHSHYRDRPPTMRIFYSLLLASVLMMGASAVMRAGESFSKELFVVSDSSPVPMPAAKANAVKSGLSLKQLVELLGPGWMPRFSGTGIVAWSFADGRELWLSGGDRFEATNIVTFKVSNLKKGYNHLSWHQR